MFLILKILRTFPFTCKICAFDANDNAKLKNSKVYLVIFLAIFEFRATYIVSKNYHMRKHTIIQPDSEFISHKQS